jgi:hypothetical protein
LLEEVGAEQAESLYPSSDDAHAKLLRFWTKAFLAADDAKKPYEENWDVYYQLRRSHLPERQPGDWHSKVFIPLVFFTIQTILPRLVASLPRGVVHPVGPEDASGASAMEELLEWAADQSDLMLQLVIAYDSALTYGTGILKTRPMKRSKKRKVKTPEMEAFSVLVPTPVIDPDTGEPMRNLDTGQPMIEDVDTPFGERPVIDQVTGEPKVRSEEQEAIGYVGPVATAVDIYNIFPAPEAENVEDARYIIHRRWADAEEVKRLVKDGTYHLPEGMSLEQMWSRLEDPKDKRLQEVGLGAGRPDDSEHVAEVWECWRRSDNTVCTILNQKAIVRNVENPFDHGEFPFIRILDHLNPHEFFGTGEVEHLEGIQDAVNAVWNQRIDNERLLLNAMFIYDRNAIKNTNELVSRPGGGIAVDNEHGQPLDQVVQRLEFGDVNGSAYEEVASLIDMSEKISGANGFTAGGDPAESMNQTATGAAIITEQGNTRFTMKAKLAELTGLRALFRQYASLLQQFTPPDMTMRIIGDDGSIDFQPIDVAALEGAFDIDIEAESSTQTESMRKDQSMSLLQIGAQMARADGSPVFNIDALAEDFLRAWQKKDVARYIAQAPPPMQIDPETGLPIQEQLPPELQGLEPGAPPPEQMAPV